MIELTHAEIEALLGAYALNATDPDELEAIDRHLEGCPRCRAEVADHREVAALLANGGQPAPEGIWDRIVGALEEAPPPMRLPLLPPEVRSSRRTVSMRTVAALATAAALVIGALTVGLIRDDNGASTPQALTALAEAAHLALTTPAADHADLRSPDGTLNASAVVLPNGNGYLFGEALPALEGGRTYQLWGAATSGAIVSLGLMGDRPKVVPFSAAGPITQLMITTEAAGGAGQPTSQPILVGTLAS